MVLRRLLLAVVHGYAHFSHPFQVEMDVRLEPTDLTSCIELLGHFGEHQLALLLLSLSGGRALLDLHFPLHLLPSLLTLMLPPPRIIVERITDHTLPLLHHHLARCVDARSVCRVLALRVRTVGSPPHLVHPFFVEMSKGILARSLILVDRPALLLLLGGFLPPLSHQFLVLLLQEV